MSEPIKIYTCRLQLESEQGPHFLDLTEALALQLGRCNLREGRALVFSRHTTASLVIQENEPLLLEDMKKKLLQIASPEEKFLHDDFSIRTENLVETQDANGHAHCQSLFLRQSVQIPILEGKLALGRWQRVFFLELDCARAREVLVQFWGVG